MVGHELRTQNPSCRKHKRTPILMLNFLDGTASVLLGIAIATTLILLWAAALVDLFQRRDLSLIKKIAWVGVIIVTAHIGVAFYFAMRPIPPPYGKGIRHTVDRSSKLVTELERLHADHARGAMTDGSYLDAKQDLLGVAR